MSDLEYRWYGLYRKGTLVAVTQWWFDAVGQPSPPSVHAFGYFRPTVPEEDYEVAQVAIEPVKAPTR